MKTQIIRKPFFAIFALLLLALLPSAWAATEAFDSTTTWVCPAGVTSVQVECWGGGGAGGSASRNPGSSSVQYGGGGAGGAYAKINSYPVTPGNTYYVNVGAGGNNSSAVNDTRVNGEDSWLNSVNSPSATILAKGGQGGESAIGNTTTTRYGLRGLGSATGSFGDTVVAGGNGAEGGTLAGGSGGSSPGTDGSAAVNATTPNTGAATIAPAGGGDGGSGPTASGAGGNGGVPGGGGGGARDASSTTIAVRNGGIGGKGRVVLTYTIPNTPAKNWSGSVNSDWDINTTTNWIIFPSETPATYLESSIPGDAVTFDDSAAGTTTVNLTTNLSPEGVLVTNVSKTYTFNGSGALSGTTGLTKQGSGTLILDNSGTNDFTGPVAIEGGTVQLSGSDDRVPTNGTVTLADVAGAALDLNGLNQTLASLNGGGAVGGNVSLGAGNLTVNGGGGIFAGVISGGGAFTKTGSGTQVLSGANVHSGGIEVQGGTLTLANTTGSGAGSGSVSVTSTNGTLRLGDGVANGSVAVGTIANEGLVALNRSDDLTFTTLITGGGGFRKENTNNTVTIPISQSYTGITTVVAGALRISNAGALGDANGVTSINNDATSRLELTGNLFLLEPLSIAQKGTAAGYAPGVFNVSGTNTLAGPITLPAGGSFWIIASDAGKLVVSGPTTNTTTSNTRTLWLSGAAEGEWNTDLPDGTAPSKAALRKDGTGTWKLGSTVTYTGPTVVSNGTLVVNGTIANSSGVTVAGGTLAGTGNIASPVTVDTAGNLAPGDGGIGTLTAGSAVTLAGTTVVELNATTADKLNATGSTVTLGGTLNITNVGGLTLVNGTVYDLFEGTLSGSFATINLPGGPSHWNTTELAAGGNGTLTFNNSTPAAADFDIGVASYGSATIEVLAKYVTDADVGDTLTLTSVSSANATIVGGTIVYTNASGANDSFTYTVSDGLTTATGTVTVTTYSSQGFNKLSGPIDNGNGTLTLNYLGIPNEGYALETTANLTPPTWVAIQTNAAAGNGTLSFTFPTGDSQGFFRTRHVSP